MDSAQREAIAERVLRLSNADQTEVTVAYERNALTRFARNAVHQNVADEDTSVRVRSIVGKRTGVAVTNRLDDDALSDLAERAVTMAQLAPEDPELPPLPAGGPTTAPAGAYAGATDAASPQTRADLCDAIFAVTHDAGYWNAGYAATAASGITIANSSGARASFDGTDAGINIKMSAPDSTGYAECYANDVRSLDARALASVAARKARDSAAPRSVEPGEWTVILEPAAFGELFDYITGHFSAQSFDEGSSCFSDALGTRVFGENVTIVDDYAHPLSPGMPFDYEGQPTLRLPIVENGIAKTVVTDSYWAHKLRRENTGHALPAPNAYGPQAMHLVVSPGTKPVEQLIAETNRGLLVSRFWYIRTVDQKKAIVTGMTRDGTFLIENGVVGAGVRNMRFNQSIIDALRRCEFANALRRTGGYAYSVVVPAAKIEGFTFSSGTEF